MEEKIRTCKKCKLSEVLSSNGTWIILFTRERIEYIAHYLGSDGIDLKPCNGHGMMREEIHYLRKRDNDIR